MFGRNAASPEEGPGPAADDSPEAAIARLTAEVEELNSKHLRTLADYQNSQRRAAANEREARQQGVASVVVPLLTVIDHFDLALSQDASAMSASQLLDGVRVIRDELVRTLGSQGVTPIVPAPNDPFDPMRHEAITQQPAAGVQPGHVAATLQPGYLLGERVIRSAKVAVAP